MDLMFRHDMTPTQRLIWLKRLADGGSSSILKTVSGALLHITDALAKPAKKFVATLEPIQSGSGDPSPENIRPITGHTGANVYRTGVNIWDEEWEIGTINVSTGDNDNSQTGRWRSKNCIAIKPDTQYCYRWGIADGSKVTGRVAYYDRNKNFISGNASFPSGSSSFSNPLVFTTPADAYYMRFSPASGTTYGNDTCINYPSTDTSYHAYSGQAIPITFPDAAGTVYGGTLTNEGGEWKLRVEYADVDLGALSWSLEYGRFNAQLQSIKPSGGGSYKPNILCSAYPTITPNEWYGKTTGITSLINGYIGNGYVGLIDSQYPDVASLKTAVSGVQLVYELATPIDYTLSESQALTLLKGENNVWCDASDDLELQYYAKAEETP